MNYEELYSEYQVLEKEMKDKINGVQKLHKMIAKEMENGDLKCFNPAASSRFLRTAFTFLISK